MFSVIWRRCREACLVLAALGRACQARPSSQAPSALCRDVLRRSMSPLADAHATDAEVWFTRPGRAPRCYERPHALRGVTRGGRRQAVAAVEDAAPLAAAVMGPGASSRAINVGASPAARRVLSRATPRRPRASPPPSPPPPAHRGTRGEQAPQAIMEVLAAHYLTPEVTSLAAGMPFWGPPDEVRSLATPPPRPLRALSARTARGSAAAPGHGAARPARAGHDRDGVGCSACRSSRSWRGPGRVATCSSTATATAGARAPGASRRRGGGVGGRVM